jgi:amino acid transporter
MAKSKKLSLTEAISMAVGTMIGASIFSIFGLGAQIAGQELALAFVLSGIYALVVAYSYARLGRRIISNAGPIAFIRSGIGENLLTGTLSILMWFTYVISIALFVKGFAGYFLPLFNIAVNDITHAITEVVAVLFFTSLHFYGSKAVGRAEKYFVVAKLAILLLFIIGGFMSMKETNILPQFNPQASSGLINASVIFFLSYMGFGLITNTSENIKNPGRNVPLAIFISILIVMAFYVLISLVTLGNLSVEQLVNVQENALAEAAKPFLGQFGFLLISISALLSLSASLNATIFGGANIAYSLAKDGKLPAFFQRKLWFKSTEGLFITAGLGLFIAMFFNLTEIATLTSTIFTVIYICVVISHLRLLPKVGGNKLLLIFNLMVLVAIFFALMNYQWESERQAFMASIYTFAGAFLAEYIYRKIKHRKFKKFKERQELSSL